MLNKTSMWDMVNSTQLRTFIYLPQEICCEGKTNMPGIPIRSVRGVLQDVVYLRRQCRALKPKMFSYNHTQLI